MGSTQAPSGLRFCRARRDELMARRDELQYGSGYFNDRRIPYFEARPLCPEGDMCTHCEFALHQTMWPEEPEDPIFFGFVDCMMATEACDVCKFLTRLFFDASLGFLESEVVRESNRRRFCLSTFGLASERVTELQPREDQWSAEVSVSVHEVSDFDLQEGDSVPYEPKDDIRFRLDVGCHAEFMRLVVQGQSEEAAVLSLSREIGEFWNFALFKDALRACVSSHGRKCDMPVGGFSRHEHLPSVTVEIGAQLRVVDVTQLCITMLPQGSPYVALSYCWPKTKYTVLTLSNYNRLADYHGLLSCNLPPTILDAIQASRELGHDYIWIDSLCIIQDDPSSKTMELARMDDIYRAALLAIVGAAARADGTDPGLPGVSDSSRRGDRAILDVRGLRFRQSVPNLWNALQETRWHSRAWTFQEYLLSKRLLVFMPEQVYWICDESCFSEDYVDHVCSKRSAMIVEQSIAPCCDLSILETESDGKASVRPCNYFNDYSGLVSLYTRREMSFNSDAVNAARGLLRLLEREHNVPFLCGLPVPHLVGFFLSWCPVGPSRRRQPSSASEDRFPTWSWAGWHGEAIYASTCFPGVLTDDGFDKSGISVDLDDEITDWSIMLPSDSSFTDLPSVKRHRPGSVDVKTIDHCLLHFTADVACFRISGSAYGTPADMHGKYNFNGSTCRQIILDGTHAGVLLLHCSTMNGKPYFEAEKHVSPNFIALSRGEPRWRMWYLISDGDPADSANWWYEDDDGPFVEHPPFDESVYDLMGKVVNVLLICTASSGISYRAGVGQIHADAWDAVERKSTSIVLG